VHKLVFLQTINYDKEKNKEINIGDVVATKIKTTRRGFLYTTERRNKRARLVIIFFYHHSLSTSHHKTPSSINISVTKILPVESVWVSASRFIFPSDPTNSVVKS